MDVMLMAARSIPIAHAPAPFVGHLSEKGNSCYMYSTGTIENCSEDNITFRVRIRGYPAIPGIAKYLPWR